MHTRDTHPPRPVTKQKQCSCGTGAGWPARWPTVGSLGLAAAVQGPISFFFFKRCYLFIHRHREREAETQAEGEAGSMQGARYGTRSRVSRITPQAAGGAKPLRHQGCPRAHFLLSIHCSPHRAPRTSAVRAGREEQPPSSPSPGPGGLRKLWPGSAALVLSGVTTCVLHMTSLQPPDKCPP